MYDREKAVAYAREWAFLRNPEFYDFEDIGGDCTNFVSQCMYAGGAAMNYTPDFGWYFISPSDRSAAWSGVEYLYRFLTTNQGVGPYGTELPLNLTQKADVVQISFDGKIFSHTVIVVDTGIFPSPENILIASHSFDSLDRPLNTYNYKALRLIHIEGSRDDYEQEIL